ncbi:MAG: PhzF family phenazine biosynthesis protein [bacterium]
MKCYFVDAFADKLFEGNPAAVCVLGKWLPDEMMQNIAVENNLSETAFTVKEGDAYHLRWFTPGGEIDLCGHATLATSFVLANFVEPKTNEFVFNTLSGRLTVTRQGDLYEMDFPAYNLTPVPITDEMVAAMGVRPVEAYVARDLLCVFEHEDDVITMNPDQEKVKALGGLLLNVTAPGTKFDCVSRSFAPKCNIAEDPVCGSGHCHVIPYWAQRLNKDKLVARQASARGGTLYCEVCGERIKIAGRAVIYAIAELYVE